MSEKQPSGLQELLDHPTKKVHEATGVLAKMFRQLLHQTNTTPQHFDRLLTHWLNDPENGVANDMKRRSSARGNLVKEILRPDMTWKVFIKGVKLLKPQYVEFSFKFTWPLHEHTISMRSKVSDIQIPPDEEVDQ